MPGNRLDMFCFLAGQSSSAFVGQIYKVLRIALISAVLILPLSEALWSSFGQQQATIQSLQWNHKAIILTAHMQIPTDSLLSELMFKLQSF